MLKKVVFRVYSQSIASALSPCCAAQAYLEKSNRQISGIVELVRGKLASMARITLGALTVLDVHGESVGRGIHMHAVYGNGVVNLLILILKLPFGKINEWRKTWGKKGFEPTTSVFKCLDLTTLPYK